MGDIAQRGNRLTQKRNKASKEMFKLAQGKRIRKFGGGRTNLLEELGRVEGERSNPNRRAEISRVHGELNRGYAKGGRIGLKNGGSSMQQHYLEHGYGPHKKRKRKAIGGAIKKVIQGGKKIIDKIKTGKSNKFDTWETIGIPGSPGPKKGKYKHIDTIMESIEKQKKTGKAEGGRIGLNKGSKSKPWGTGPKPGTHEFLQQHLHKPRKGKAIGGVLKHAIKKLRPGGPFKPKKKVYPETEDLTHQKGPYVGDVGSEGKRRKAGPSGKGKSPGRPKAPGPKGRRPWRDAIPGRPSPGTPAPNWIKPKKYQPAAEGGRIGLKKGGSDKNWIQKAVNPKHKGYCTPMTKKTCTPARKALARTFKKKAKTGW